MNPRRIAAAFWLVFALAFGQQAAALHGLAHAIDRMQQQDDGLPAKHTCDQCFVGAQLSGAVGVAFATLDVVAPGSPLAASADDLVAPARTPLYFHSRAPPRIA